MTKEKMLITKLNDNCWSVEVYDKHGNWTKVYEETIDDCREFAKEFQGNADTLKAKNDSWGKCVKELIKNDRKKGLNWE